MSAKDIISLARELAALGYCPGGAGNISWRDGQELLIAKSGVDLATIGIDDIVRCTIDWKRRVATDGEGMASKELPMHIAMHARKPELQGFVGHVHSPCGVAASCLPAYSTESAIPPLTPYFHMKVGSVPLIDYAEPGSQSQADEIFSLDSTASTILLQNHGFSAWAATTDAVVERLRESELTAAIWLQIRGASDVRVLSVSEQSELERNFGLYR